MTPDEARAELQRLPGIGPFYSALVVVRACGLTDVLSTQEPHSRRAVRSLYGLDHEPDDAELASIAEAWRPFRTWATVALRAVGPRLGTTDGTTRGTTTAA
jgi:DNA-3-methyladenine glycosylase II